MLANAWPVLAHTQTGQAQGLLTGLRHPASGLDHVLAMIAVGLWGAQLGAPAIWLLPVTFPMIMACLHKHSLGACVPEERMDGKRFIRDHVELMLHQGSGELQTVTGADLRASHHEAREDPYRLAVGLIGAEAMLRRSDVAGEAFNFSNELEVTVLELTQRILRALGSDLEPDVRNEPGSAFEIRAQTLSAAKASMMTSAANISTSC